MESRHTRLLSNRNNIAIWKDQPLKRLSASLVFYFQLERLIDRLQRYRPTLYYSLQIINTYLYLARLLIMLAVQGYIY